jgi:hypothetical protein
LFGRASPGWFIGHLVKISNSWIIELFHQAQPAKFTPDEAFHLVLPKTTLTTGTPSIPKPCSARPNAHSYQNCSRASSKAKLSHS